MKLTFVFVLIACLCVSSANAFSTAEMAKLSNVSKTSFGKNLMDKVSSMMSMGGAVDDILMLLDDLKQALIDEQDRDDELNRTEERNFRATENETRFRIQTAAGQVAEANNEIEEVEAALEQNALDITENGDLRQANRDYYNRADQARADEAAAHQRRMEDHELAYNILAELRGKVEEIVPVESTTDIEGGGDVTTGDHERATWQEIRAGETESFLETSTVTGMKKLANNVLRSRSFHPTVARTYGTAFAALAHSLEVNTKITPAAHANLLNLIQHLKETLEASEAEFRAAEAAAIQRFATLKDDLDAEYAALEDDLARLEELKLVLEAALETAQSKLEINTTELNNATSLLAALREQWAQQSAHYQSERENRGIELGAIMQVYDVIVEGYSGVKGYLKERIDEYHTDIRPQN